MQRPARVPGGCAWSERCPGGNRRHRARARCVFETLGPHVHHGLRLLCLCWGDLLARGSAWGVKPGSFVGALGTERSSEQARAGSSVVAARVRPSTAQQCTWTTRTSGTRRRAASPSTPSPARLRGWRSTRPCCVYAWHGGGARLCVFDGACVRLCATPWRRADTVLTRTKRNDDDVSSCIRSGRRDPAPRRANTGYPGPK